MTQLEKITKMLKENGIIYFQGNSENENVFNLPYSGIEYPDDSVNVYMEIIEPINIIRFSIYRMLNGISDNAELKSKLLDLNSSLTVGAFALQSDSNLIEYNVDYTIGDNDLPFKLYNYYVGQCVKAFEKLKDINIEAAEV